MSKAVKEAQIDTVVIGAGQAGLAAGYHLARHRVPFTIFDKNERVGDPWRTRWDSLRLFTPARYNSLPGMRFPGPQSANSTKDEVADYMEGYAQHFEFPVRTAVTVESLSKVGDRFEVAHDQGSMIATNVIVATGAYQRPRIPTFASELDPTITQLSANEYRNPSQLRDGGVLVVGAGNSGAEIAIDIARPGQTFLSGPDTGQEPTRAGSRPDRLITPIFWLLITRVLTVNTFIGRKVRDQLFDPPRGIPLGRVRRKEIPAAGIEPVPRTIGVKDGMPVLEDGRVMVVSNVIWCTGYVPDFSWIQLPLPSKNGYPIQQRGIVESQPGLYFLGLPFLFSLSSALVGGVGRDAEHVVAHLIDRARDPTGRTLQTLTG
jgi:putative flavoprotein involved in K+ transport